MKLFLIFTLAFVLLIPIFTTYGSWHWSSDIEICGDEICEPETVSVFVESFPDLAVKVETISENLSIPWSIDFASDGRIFFSERTGTLQVIDNGIQKQIMTLDVGGGEGGMLGIALDPNFENNHYIYIYYTYNEIFSTKNKLVRYVESNNSLTEDRILLEGIPGASYHDTGFLI